MWYSFVSVLTDIETDKAPPSGASAKHGTVFPVPSPSSSDSTLALSDRSSSFGSDYSTSPTNGGGGSGSAFAAGGFRASRTAAAMGGGGEQTAIDQHQEAERRIECGGCPRLPSFVDLSRGVPTAPATPTSPDAEVAGKGQ